MILRHGWKLFRISATEMALTCNTLDPAVRFSSDIFCKHSYLYRRLNVWLNLKTQKVLLNLLNTTIADAGV